MGDIHRGAVRRRSASALSVSASESPPGVWHALPSSLANLTHPGSRSAPNRSPDRLPGGAAHLGSTDASASASALPRSRRRHRPESLPLDPHAPHSLLLTFARPRGPFLPLLALSAPNHLRTQSADGRFPQAL